MPMNRVKKCPSAHVKASGSPGLSQSLKLNWLRRKSLIGEDHRSSAASNPVSEPKESMVARARSFKLPSRKAESRRGMVHSLPGSRFNPRVAARSGQSSTPFPRLAICVHANFGPAAFSVFFDRPPARRRQVCISGRYQLCSPETRIHVADPSMLPCQEKGLDLCFPRRSPIKGVYFEPFC
jgi:hypothetical protein